MKKEKWFIALSVFLLVLQGCSEDNVDENPKVNGKDVKNLSLGEGMIRSGDVMASTKKVLMSESDVSVEKTVVDDLEGVYIKKTRVYKTGLVYTEHLLFDPINSYLYPGLVFVGNSIATGEYIPVPNQNLSPITITTSLTPETPGTGEVAKRIENIRYSSYIDALKDWRAQQVKPTGASTEYEVLEFNSEREFQGKLGIGFTEGSTGIGGKIELGGGFMRKKNHVLVKFVQKLFSTSMDIPEGGQILQEVNLDDLKHTMPVYISDMFYGRMAFAVISSNASLTKLKAALSLIFPSANPNIDVAAEYSSILEDADVKAICIGGASNQHGYLVSEGWKGLKKFLSEEIEVSSAVPVSFILKYADDNSIARVLSSQEVPVLESYFIPNSTAVNFGFRAEGLKAKAGVDKKMQVYGKSVFGLTDNSSLHFADEQKEVVLIDVPKKNYVAVPSTGDFTEIESLSEDVESTILRTEGMNMEAFLEQKVRFTTQLNKTDVYGNMTGASLGNTSSEITLKDLIFYAEHGNLEIKVKANRLIDHNAALKFRFTYKMQK